MDLINVTGMQAGYALGMEPSGREYLVVVVKGTFTIPAPGQAPALAKAQLPLVAADTFTGEPGLSALVYEADYPLRKPAPTPSSVRKTNLATSYFQEELHALTLPRG